jgi:hypothetical protein
MLPQITICFPFFSFLKIVLQNPDIMIFGWDLEFFYDFNTMLYKQDAIQMAMYLPVAGMSAKMNQKIVLLTHPHLHDTHSQYGIENLKVFNEFLDIALDLGYEFRTLDTYITD